MGSGDIGSMMAIRGSSNSKQVTPLSEVLDVMSLSKSEMDAEIGNEYALEYGRPVGSWEIPRRFSDVWYDLKTATILRVLRSIGEEENEYHSINSA